MMGTAPGRRVRQDASFDNVGIGTVRSSNSVVETQPRWHLLS